MALMVLERVGIVGCGLIGGSLALALRRAGLARHIVGYSPSQASREQAVALGAIDEAVTTAQAAAEGCDLVVLAVPVAATAATMQTVAPSLTAQAMVMDVGSTKGDVVAAARATLGKHLTRFVPAHPIAGKAETGVAHAQATLFRGARVILTPVAETQPEVVARASMLWTAVGARVATLSAATHDEIFAAVSHAPHLFAFAYMQAMLADPAASKAMAWAGPGFRDFTRIAGGDATLWRDVLLANAEQVLQQSKQFRAALTAMEALMENRDSPALHAALLSASQGRAAWAQATANDGASYAATAAPAASDNAH
jgi:prephenate dehydrogenase